MNFLPVTFLQVSQQPESCNYLLPVNFLKFHNSQIHIIIGLIACYFCASFTTDKAIRVLHLLPVIFAQVSQQTKPYEFCTYCLLFLRKFHNSQSHMSFALIACYFCASFTTDKVIWVLHLLFMIIICEH